jgi:hypothetical protein
LSRKIGKIRRVIQMGLEKRVRPDNDDRNGPREGVRLDNDEMGLEKRISPNDDRNGPCEGVRPDDDETGLEKRVSPNDDRSGPREASKSQG